jgi:uncharacterized protein YjbJ (UPF0337 family)
MNHERWAGLCEQLAGRLEEHWGRLTNDRQRTAAGLGRQRAGMVRELRGRARDAARRELARFHAGHRGWKRPGAPKARVVSIDAQRRLRRTAPNA